MNLKSALVALAIFSFTGIANANLITNGDFETGDFSGWNTNLSFYDFVQSNFDGYNPEGSFAAYFGCLKASCGKINQTIATTPGAHYTFSFLYGSDGSTPNEFIANFDGVTVFNTVDDLTDTRPRFVAESFTVTATGPTTLVEFIGRNVPHYQALDNVSVTTAVPEPENYAMLMAGLGVMGFIARRRKVQQA